MDEDYGDFGFDGYDTDDLQWRSDQDAWEDAQADMREYAESEFDEDDGEFEAESPLLGFGLDAPDAHLESDFEDRCESES